MAIVDRPDAEADSRSARAGGPGTSPDDRRKFAGHDGRAFGVRGSSPNDAVAGRAQLVSIFIASMTTTVWRARTASPGVTATRTISPAWAPRDAAAPTPA